MWSGRDCFLQVHNEVPFQRVLLVEGLAAEGAAEWPLSRVDAQVPVHLALAERGERAVGAGQHLPLTREPWWKENKCETQALFFFYHSWNKLSEEELLERSHLSREAKEPYWKENKC